MYTWAVYLQHPDVRVREAAAGEVDGLERKVEERETLEERHQACGPRHVELRVEAEVLHVPVCEGA